MEANLPFRRPIMKITDLPRITSKDNSRLKRARAVRDGREREMIFVEGVRLVTELIRSPLAPVELFVSDEFCERNGELIQKLASDFAPEIHEVELKIFNSIVDTENSQGIVVLAARPQQSDFNLQAIEKGLFIYLNKINNPSNLGAVVRSSEAVGVQGVLTSPESTDIFSPKAIRASMGSAFRLPLYSDIPLEEAVNLVKEQGMRVVAADISAKKSYTEAIWSGPTMLVLGSEAHGLREAELALVDETVLIPMENGVESLNLAVSAGIILFEAKRQQTEGGR